VTLRVLVAVRNAVFVAVYDAILLLTPMPTQAEAQYGAAEEAKALLDKAVAAVTRYVQQGDGGFRDRDLYVFCANASDGIVTAHPTNKGEQLKDVVGKKGFPLGKEIMQRATEGSRRSNLLVASSRLG
jgi:hypothetical protein